MVLEDSPVKHIVVLEALADEEIAEQFAQVAVIRLVIEAQRPDIIEIGRKLLWEPLACNKAQQISN